MPHSLDTLVKRRAEVLSAYQDAAYAELYLQLVNQVRSTESGLGLGNQLSTAVAKYYFKLMAYKDEYEVARLYTDGRFVEQLQQQFEGDFTLKFNLAPPFFSKKDGQGHLIKAQYGSWVWQGFKLLAKARKLRGTRFDIFAYSADRKMERQLIADSRATVLDLLGTLDAGNHAAAIEIAALPEKIRGFGHLKEKAVHEFRLQQAALQDRAAARLATEKSA